MEQIKKYWKIVVGIIILIIIFSTVQTCNNNKYQQLKGEYTILKEQYKVQKDGVKILEKRRLREKDSLLKENASLQVEKTKSKEKIANLENKIKDKEAQLIKDKEKIKKLSYVEAAKEYNNIYKTNEATATNNSVDLKGTLPTKVLETVYEAIYCIETSKVKDSIIVEQKDVISKVEKQKDNLGVLLNSAEKEVKARKDLEELADKNIDNLEKQNKKLRTKNILNKILIIGGTVLGALIGNQLSK